MRGAEFSSSAKRRTKNQQSASTRDVRSIAVNGGAVTGGAASNGALSGSAQASVSGDSDAPSSAAEASHTRVIATSERDVSAASSTGEAGAQPPAPSGASSASLPKGEAPTAAAVEAPREKRESLITGLARRLGSSPAASPAPLSPNAVTVNASSSSSQKSELVAALSDHVVFNDEKLARKYASEPIPISLLYEAYFDGSIDIPGDLVEFLEHRAGFVKHTITRQHLQWAVTNFVPEMVVHSREADARTARELYDERGDDFFRAFLGERLAFTCAHIESPADSLEMGNEQMSAKICEKIGLRASHRVLDVGCGWGNFLAHVAASRGAEGVGVTLSRAQEAYANRRFTELGVEHQARAVLADYRDLPSERFDRVVCLEAVERVGVKNLKLFFEKIAERLHDDGLFFLQWTGLRRQLRPEDLMWGLFMNKYIFPGADAGLPLSSMLKVAEKAGWEVQNVENISRHYTQTLRLWRGNWLSNRERVVAAHGERWFRIWHFFLAWSQIVGEQGSAACFQVVMNKNLDTLDRRILY